MSQLRHYETTYILHPDIDDAVKNTVAERVENIIKSFDGEIVRVEEWGRRKLAYRVKKQTRGVYVYVRYTATADSVAELERILRLLDSVLKFLTIKVDVQFEEEQRVARERLAQRIASGRDDDDEDDDDDDDDL